MTHHSRLSGLCLLATVYCLLFCSVPAARAQATLNFPTSYVAALPQVPNTTAVTFQSSPSSIAFTTSGQLFAYDGSTVWLLQPPQSGSYFSGTFAPVASVPTDGSDPGAITFSQGGNTILVSTGAGGIDSSVAGNIFTLPTATLPGQMPLPPATMVTGNASNSVSPNPTPPPASFPNGNFNLIPVPTQSTMAGAATKFYVDGYDGNAGSLVGVFDLSNPTPYGTPLQNLIAVPDFSSALAFNPKNNELYVGSNNFGSANNMTEIRAFALSGTKGLDAAFAASCTLYWSDGTPIYQNASGEDIGDGMFFDARGDLFTGASDGLLVITPGSTSYLYNHVTYDNVTYNGVTYNGTYGISFPWVTYDPATDQFILQPESNDGKFTLYPALVFNADQFAAVPEPATAALALIGGGGLLIAAARRRRKARLRAMPERLRQ